MTVLEIFHEECLRPQFHHSDLTLQGTPSLLCGINAYQAPRLIHLCHLLKQCKPKLATFLEPSLDQKGMHW